MIRNYVITAWRNIRRNKLYAAINVLGLSLSICACLIIYLITSFELRFDTFHPDKDRIYRIVSTFTDDQGKKNDMAAAVSPMPEAIRNELTGFETVTMFNNVTLRVTIPNARNEPKKFDAPADYSPILIAEPQYFEIFKYQWLAGSPKTALNEPFKVVLSVNEVQKYFGDIMPKEAIGRDVFYNDSLHVTVSGIVKDWNRPTDFAFKDFISFATVKSSFLKGLVDMSSWNLWDNNSQGYVKLAKGVTAQQVEKQFPSFMKSHTHLPPGFKAVLGLQPLADIHFNSVYDDTYSHKTHLPTLYGLIGIAAFILIIAVINFINLSTAQSVRRAKEVGVRKTLGGSKADLTIQFLIETFMVTILALVISLIVTNPIIAAFKSIIPTGVTLSLANPLTVGFLVLTTVITALFAGFYPARVLSANLPALSLKGQGSLQLNGKSYLRKGLIVFQFTISLMFIIGTVVIANQIHFVLNKDLGFNKEAIITTNIARSNNSGAEDVFIDKIKQIKGVELVTRHRVTPVAVGHPSTFITYKGPGGSKVEASFETCDNNYVNLFDLKIIAGRNLLPSDTLKEFLVNETCAKALGFKKPEDALGKLAEVGINNASLPIVGVVKDFHSKSLHDPITPFFIGSIKKNERAVSLKLAISGKNTAGLKRIIAQLENAAKEVYPSEKFEYKFFDESIARLYDKEQKTARLMNTAMIVAIFISCMGLFGLAAFTAQQRVKEIGIRKVLGASALSIFSMLSKEFLALVIVAILIASPIAWYLAYQWLHDFTYKVDISWGIFAGSGLAAIFIAFITISFQSIKAAIAKPVVTLRNE